MDKSRIEDCVRRITDLREKLDSYMRLKNPERAYVYDQRQLCEDLILETAEIVCDFCDREDEKERWGLPDPFEDDEASDLLEVEDPREMHKSQELTRSAGESYCILGDMLIELEELLKEMER